MSKFTNRSFIGGGGIYFKEAGSNKPRIPVGNCESLSFAISEDQRTQRNFQQPGGGNIASQSAITDVTATLTALSLQPETIAVALRALVVTVDARAVAAEQHKAYMNGFLPFNYVPDTSQTITVTSRGGSTTYVEGTDYQVRQSGIFIPETSTIPNVGEVAGADIDVNYQSRKTYDIESITKASVDYEIYFDGFNDADNGKPVTVECFKVKFSPTQALDLISEDFGSLPMTFQVLADTTRSGASTSQYFKVRMAD